MNQRAAQGEQSYGAGGDGSESAERIVVRLVIGIQRVKHVGLGFKAKQGVVREMIGQENRNEEEHVRWTVGACRSTQFSSWLPSPGTRGQRFPN